MSGPRQTPYAGARPFGATNRPGSCLWCGRKLRLICDTTWERVLGPPPPECRRCGGPDFEHAPVEQDALNYRCTRCGCDQRGPDKRRVISRRPLLGGRGDYGDNAFCGLRCGYAFGVALAVLGRRLQPAGGDRDR